MDETTFQETAKLPRRLPKHPNEIFYGKELGAPAEDPAEAAACFADEPVPVFYTDPGVPAAQTASPSSQYTVSPRDERPSQPVLPSVTQAGSPTVLGIPPGPVTPVEMTPPVTTGDPKPAFARPSGPSRSRPPRPSGAFSVARSSGALQLQASRGALEPPDSSTQSGAFPATIAPSSNTQSRIASHWQASEPVSRASSSSKVSRRNPKPGRTSAFTVPALITLSIALVGYSFAVGSLETYLDSLLASADAPSAALKALIPWFALIPVVVLLGGVLWILAGIIGLRAVKPPARTAQKAAARSSRKREPKRRKSPLEQFREEAAKEGINGVAAYQTWRLLQAYGPESHVLSIYDDLEATLGMGPDDILSVYQQLIPSEHRADRFHFRSVLDILRIVKKASLLRT